MATLQERMAIAKQHYEKTFVKKFKNTAMADYCGVSKVSIGQWINGPTKELDGSNLMKAAEFLGVSPKWLAGESNTMVQTTTNNEREYLERESLHKIPVLDFVQAGVWREVLYDGMTPHSYTYTNYQGAKNGSVFGLIVDGSSMSPEFLPNDLLIVDPTLAPQPGSYVIAQNSDYKATFKKYRVLSYDENGKEIFELIPLNPDFPKLNSLEHKIKIIGVVKRHIRDFN